MKNFYQLLGNAMLVATKNNFVWFALTYWIYLETKSVVSTGVVGGTYLVVSATTSAWFGSLVDSYSKKKIMLGASVATLVFFLGGLAILILNAESAFTQITSPVLWMFVLALLGGGVAGNIMGITIPTLVTVMVPEENRDKANGLFGTVMGISFAITSVASGLALAFGGMLWVLVSAIVLTVVAIAHLMTIPVPEINHAKEKHDNGEDGDDTKGMDIKGTIKAIKGIPGLFALIFFTTFNNLLGGVFMALMDAYGLTLVSVQVWGMLWGFLSFGFILGGLYITKKGLGQNPLRNLFRINIVIWIVCIFFAIQPSIILLAAGTLVWMSLVPFIEATEQTIIQKVVPVARQGRVFGFAHSIEQAASPLTAFLIGPIAQYIFIPFMTTGKGVELIGDWFGVGPGRGMALVFIAAGIVGLTVTLIARESNAYKLLAQRYSK